MTPEKTEILRSPSLAAQVHAMIKESIMNGELKSGQRLIAGRLANSYDIPA